MITIFSLIDIFSAEYTLSSVDIFSNAVRDHNSAAGELDVLWGSRYPISIFINPRVGEVLLEVAAVLILVPKLWSWHAVAACSQSCLSESNGRNVFSITVASDREIQLITINFGVELTSGNSRSFAPFVASL